MNATSYKRSWRTAVRWDQYWGNKIGEAQKTTGYIDRHWWKANTEAEQVAMDVLKSKRQTHSENITKFAQAHVNEAIPEHRLLPLSVFRPRGVGGILVAFELPGFQQSPSQGNDLYLSGISATLDVDGKQYSGGAAVADGTGKLTPVDGLYTGVTAPRGVKFQGTLRVHITYKFSWVHLDGDGGVWGTPFESGELDGGMHLLDFEARDQSQDVQEFAQSSTSPSAKVEPSSQSDTKTAQKSSAPRPKVEPVSSQIKSDPTRSIEAVFVQVNERFCRPEQVLMKPEFIYREGRPAIMLRAPNFIRLFGDAKQIGYAPMWINGYHISPTGADPTIGKHYCQAEVGRIVWEQIRDWKPDSTEIE